MGDAKQKITQEILNHGPMAVSRYMEISLHDPEVGYYRRQMPLGEQGDFITSPEIHQIFGEMIGIWLVQAWQNIGSPCTFTLLELGPGTGQLLQDVHLVMRKVPKMEAACHLRLHEINDQLKAIQRYRLSPLYPRTDYTDEQFNLPQAPALVIANEFFDALPIEQWVFSGGQWRTRVIDVAQDGEFHFSEGAVVDQSKLELYGPPLSLDCQHGDIFECSPSQLTLVKLLAERLRHHGGAFLFIDYGHGRTGLGDSLQALSRHQKINPLRHAGHCDLTSHVDFAAFGRRLANLGAMDMQLETQADFLVRMGVVIRAGQLRAGLNPSSQRQLDQALHRLMASNEMGHLFKALSGKFSPEGLRSGS